MRISKMAAEGKLCIVLLSALCTTLLLGTTIAAQPAEARSVKYNLDIPSQNLNDALQALALASQHKLLYSSELVDGRKSPALKGQFTAEQAVKALLSGTNLSYQVTSDGLVLIRAADPPPSTNSTPRTSGGSADSSIRLAQAYPAATPPGNSATTGNQTVPKKDKEESKSSSSDAEKAGLTEIVVTGTHIHGKTDSASPLQVYSREQIDRAGFGSVASLMQYIPANFGGGATENSFSGVNGGGNALNSVGATGVNLRGLGNDATLVLIDGQRMSPANIRGNFVDVSLIPLSALERIEIVPDGASAIYGADAVGGVINFILRRNFDGSETRARYGSVTSGDRHEYEVSQALGRDWGTGSALLTYEYSDQSALAAWDRSYTSSAREPFTLLPEQVRHSAFLNVEQGIDAGPTLSAKALFSHRSTESAYSYPAASQIWPAQIDAFSGTAGLRDTAFSTLNYEASANYSGSKTHQTGTIKSAPTYVNNATTRSISGDLNLDGHLMTIRSGPVLFAAGAQYRRETYDLDTLYVPNPLSASNFRPSRNVAAGYLEVRIPIIGPTLGRTSPTAELTIADRQEHYSDFGSTNNPHLGLTWSPIADLKLRGTLGTSFKAPLLVDLNSVPVEVDGFREFDPRANSFVNTILVFGGNPQLQPEKATSWTAGFDLLPTALPGFKFASTYYKIHFRNRIASPQGGPVNITDALRSESLLGPQVVQRDPSPALVQQLEASPKFFNYGLTDLSHIAAIVDSRSHNLSIVDTSGIDASLSYATSTAAGNLDSGIDATRILKYDTRFTRASSVVALLDTPYEPPHLKLRGHVSLEHREWTVAAFLNYTTSYEDNRVTPAVPVASWTTVDLSARYAPMRSAGVLTGSSVQIGALNVGDKKPPFLSSPFYGINYDGANANPLGRFLYVELGKRF